MVDQIPTGRPRMQQHVPMLTMARIDAASEKPHILKRTIWMAPIKMTMFKSKKID